MKLLSVGDDAIARYQTTGQVGDLSLAKRKGLIRVVRVRLHSYAIPISLTILQGWKVLPFKAGIGSKDAQTAPLFG